MSPHYAPSPPPPPLPTYTSSSIPLFTIVERLVKHAYSQLEDLGERFSTQSEAPKKAAMLNYLISMRKQFIKLLVLVKWASVAKDVQKCVDIVAYLQGQRNCFDNVVYALMDLRQMLARARTRNSDIPTALAILSTGSFPDYPLDISEAYIPLPPVSDKQVLSVLRTLSTHLALRLTLAKLPYPLRHYTLSSGRITFCVENEFWVAVSGIGSEWFAVDFGFANDQFLSEELKNDICARGDAALEKGGLTLLYSFLHQFTLLWKLNSLRQEAHEVVTGRWKNVATVASDSNALKLYYWSQTSQGSGPNSIEIFISQTPKSDPVQDLLAEEEYLLEYDRSVLDIRWTCYGEIQDLSIDPSKTSISTLIEHITTLHSQHILDEITSSLSDSPLVITRHSHCLNIQLTFATSLEICISPLRGNITLRGLHPSFYGVQQSLNAQKMSVREALLRLRLLILAEEHKTLLSVYGLDSFRLPKHSLFGEFAVYARLLSDWYLVCLAPERFLLIEMKNSESETIFYELVSQELIPKTFSINKYSEIDKLVCFAKARTAWILLTRQLAERVIPFISGGHIFGPESIPPLVIQATELSVGQWSMPNIFVRVVPYTAEIVWDLKIFPGNLDISKMLPNSDSTDVKFNPKTGQICIISREVKSAIDFFLIKIRRIDEIINQVRAVPQGLELLGFSLEGVRWGYGEFWVDVRQELAFGNDRNPHKRIRKLLEGRGILYLARILKSTLGLLRIFEKIEKECRIETYILVRSAEEYRIVYPATGISFHIQYKVKDLEDWWYICQDSGTHGKLSQIWSGQVVIPLGCIVGKGIACRAYDAEGILETLWRTVEEN